MASVTCMVRRARPGRAPGPDCRTRRAIGNGPAMTRAPGRAARQVLELGQPVLAAPSSSSDTGRADRRSRAVPASMSTVSTPMPITGDSARASGRTPPRRRACGPSVGVEEPLLAVQRASQPVRYSSQPPRGSGPWSACQGLMFALEQEIRIGGHLAREVENRRRSDQAAAGTCDDVQAVPTAQCTGASKWVPVCSPGCCSSTTSGPPRRTGSPRAARTTRCWRTARAAGSPASSTPAGR